MLRSPLGDVALRGRATTCSCRRGCSTASSPTPAPQRWLSIECAGRLRPAARSGATRSASCAWTRPTATATSGGPVFAGPRDEGMRDLVVKRGGAFHGFRYDDSPLDVVGWDGTVYPWAFPILASSRASGSVHLPPTWHGTFAARGALICSFVPRPLDFHPDAIPCPYPHASVDVRRDHLLLRGQLHLAQGRRPRQHLAPPGGRPARPAPGRLRRQHRREARPTSSRSCSTPTSRCTRRTRRARSRTPSTTRASGSRCVEAPHPSPLPKRRGDENGSCSRSLWERVRVRGPKGRQVTRRRRRGADQGASRRATAAAGRRRTSSPCRARSRPRPCRRGARRGGA